MYPQQIAPLASCPRLVAVVSGAYVHTADDGEVVTDVFPVVGLVSGRQHDALVVADGVIVPAQTFSGPGRSVHVVPCHWPQHEDLERLRPLIERTEAEAWRSLKRNEARNRRPATIA
jgi:hypothetical protein